MESMETGTRKPRARVAITQSRARVSERELEALRMRARGASQGDIASVLGVTQQAVSKMLAKLDEKASAEKRMLSHRHKIREHFVLEEVRREAWDAWERSKGKHQKKTVSSESIPSTDKDGNPSRVATKTTSRLEEEELVGDPAFLGVVITVSTKIQELWGWKAPVKVSATREPSEFEALEDARLLEIAQMEMDEQRRRLAGAEGAIDGQVLRRDADADVRLDDGARVPEGRSDV